MFVSSWVINPEMMACLLPVSDSLAKLRFQAKAPIRVRIKSFFIKILRENKKRIVVLYAFVGKKQLKIYGEGV